MEADSQTLGSKTFDNKSILSFKYIYKKVIIKDNNENSNCELRTFNYEKIAKYKMKNMNLKFLLNSIFKLKNSINKNNPLLKYIQNVKPYNYPILKLNISENEPIISEFCKNKIKNKFPKKEKILNFFSSKKNYKNFYYSRMSNIECKRINHNRNEKIILIQKHIRGFLSKKIFDEEINKIIAKKIIHKILIIQKAIRNFLRKKNSLSHLIINIIQNERINKSNKITDIFSLYHFRNLYKKNLLIQKIIKARYTSILLIQKKYKSYVFLKKVKEILKKERNSYVLTYPFNAQSVQIKIFLETSYKIYEYSICPLRKYFVLYIEKGSLVSREYLCHMIVNQNIILDKRYKYIVDKNNIIYNLIYIGEPKNKLQRLEINENLNINKIKNDKNEPKERMEKKVKKENKERMEKKEKKEKKEIKDKKKKHKHINDDSDNDFFIYCYNDNSNSTNSYSTKSEHDKLKTEMEKLIKKDENIINNNINNQDINEFLKPYKKKSENLIQKNKILNFMDINIDNNKKSKIVSKKIDLDTYFKNIMNKNEYKEKNNNKIFFNDNQNSNKEGSIQSQKLKYSNILDELSQSVSSSSRSTFSMKNINLYSKKTHQTKFCSNDSIKNISKKKVKNSEYTNNKTNNKSNNCRNKRIKLKK